MRLFLQMVGYLGWVVGSYFALLLALTLWRRSRPQHAKAWMRWIAAFNRLKRNGRGHLKLASGWYAVGFSAFCVMGMTYGATRLPKENVVTEHHVLILHRLDNGDFAYRSDEKPNGDTYRPCAIDAQNGIDVDGMLTQAIGYVADKATWQEQGTCRSIMKPEWQFWFRDEANNFTYQKESRQ